MAILKPLVLSLALLYTGGTPPTEAQYETAKVYLKKDLTNWLRNLEETVRVLSDRLEFLSKATFDLEEKFRQQVAFNAVMTNGVRMKSGQKIIMNVTLNEGSAYNATTGIFTVPIRGIYFFVVVSSPMNSLSEVSVRLTLGGFPLVYSYAYRGHHGQSATLHYVIRLNKGMRVWLESNIDTYFCGNRRTVFSGFLVHS